MNTQICTSIEQSKKLIELGLDVETADMMWEFDGNKELYQNKPTIIPIDDYIFVNDIPSWSLPALLALIPPYLGNFNDGNDFGFTKSMNGKWYSIHYLKVESVEEITPIKVITNDTAVGAAFELVCWLIENNHIKTDKQSTTPP